MGDRPTCPFVALGIEHGADEASAKRAHRALMLAGAHPDRGGDPGRAQELGGALQLITEGRAYGRGGCDCSDSRSRYQRNGASAWEAGFDPFAGTRYRNPRREAADPFRRPSSPTTWFDRRPGETPAEHDERIRMGQSAWRAARDARAERAAQERAERASRERDEERERARQRQAAAANGFRAARERHAPEEPAKGGAYHRPGKPIYQPGAANPPKSVKDLFGKKPAAPDDEEIPF